MTEYYKPEIVKESALAIDYNDPEIAGDSTLTALLAGSNDGMIKIQLEHDVILQRISRDLYKHASSGFRELYVNAVSHGCKKAISLYGDQVKPRIEITLNVADRRLIIHDIDTTGISVDVFKNIYCVAGRSGNFDSGIAGQFGLGRLAYMCLSDIVKIETWSRATDERYTVIGKSGLGYQPIKAKPQLDKPGTRITLTLREQIDLKDLLIYVADIAQYSGIDTYLTLDKDIIDRYDDIQFPAGTCQIGYAARTLKQIVTSEQKGTTWRAIEIDNPDYYFYGAWQIDSDNSIITRYRSGKVLLCSVPVEISLDLPFSAWLVNIKDERKFKPTPDRERLSDSAEREITERLTDDLRLKLAFINDIRTVSDYRSCDFKPLLNQISAGYGSSLLQNWANDEVKVLMSRLHLNISTSQHSRYNDSTLADLVSTTSKSTALIAIPQWSAKKIELVEEFNPDARLFKFVNKQYLQDTAAIQQLHDLGMTTLDEYVRANGLGFKRGVRQAKELTDLTIHQSSTYSYSYSRFDKRSASNKRISIDEVKAYHAHSDLIIARQDTAAYIDILRRVATRYEITKANVRDIVPGSVTIDELIAKVQKKIVQTSAGKMTISKLAKSNKEIVLWNYDDPDLGTLVKRSDKIIISGPGDLLFEIAACLTNAGKPYEINTYMHHDLSGATFDYHNYINDSGYSKAGDSDLIGAALHLTLLVGYAGAKHAQLVRIIQDGLKYNKAPDDAAAYVKYVKAALMPAITGGLKK